jgi:hypothetical protein
MEKPMRLVVDPGGGVRCLYGEVIPLASLGVLSIARASHVEPGQDGWYADLAPCGGPKLGPFALRSQALRAEEVWLEENLLARSSPSVERLS